MGEQIKPSIATDGAADTSADVGHHPSREVSAGGVRRRLSVALSGRDVTRRNAGAGRLSRLRGLILFGGTVSKSSLAGTVGRALVDLPLDEDSTLLSVWCDQLARLNQHVGATLAGRLILSPGTHLPAPKRTHSSAHFSFELDPSELRGTGGLLHDLLASAEDDECFLVANASQLPLEPLGDIAEAMDQAGGDLTLLAGIDQTASGMMLLSAATVRGLPPLGFVDLKEQGLAAISRDHRVTVRTLGVEMLSVRTTAEYVAAVRSWHRQSRGLDSRRSPFDEGWRSSVKLVERGATVDPSAALDDSIVLAGGRVDANAVVVRSVVSGVGRVPRGHRVYDELVGPA